MATINGKAGINDDLVGTDLDDIINGLSGNDTLTGGAGRDLINGGDGDDFLTAGGNGDPYDASAFHKAANDILDGGYGNDTAYLDYKDVVVTSTDKPIEITLVFGSSFQLQIQGFVGATVNNVENLWISLPNGNDNVTLGNGDDRVWAGYGDDTVMAGGGDDVVQDVGGKSKFDGGDGNDTIAYDWSGFNWGMSFDLATGKIKVSGTDAPVDGDYGTAIHFEQLSINGSTGFDTIAGGAKADVFNDYSGGAYFNGGGGDDDASLQYQSKAVLGTLIGGAGNDTLSGGFGTMYIDGGTGNDTLTGSAGTDDTIYGGDGNDIIHVSQNDTTFMDGKYDAGSGNDTVYAGWDFGSNKGTTIFEGGAGTDKLIIGLGNAKHFDALTEQGVKIANFATISGFEQFDITGTDAYTGFDGGETIATLDLADVIRGVGGDDTLNGRGGDDMLDGGAGADKLIGGAGSDTASYTDSYDPNIINLADQSKNRGDAAGDSYSSIENIIGGQDSDTITGDDKGNMLAGGDADGYPSPYSDGDDIIDGGGGSDTAAFNHNFDMYTIVKQKDGSCLVTDTTYFHTNGADTLINIEKLKFADKTITLSSLGNAPPTGLKLSNADIDENAKVGTLIGKFAAKDGDGDALTYTLTSDAKGAFDIHGTSLVSGKKFDYETAHSYAITVSVSDGTDTAKKTFTITVDDAVETIKGTSKANNLIGGIGADRIIGLAGNDMLTGGKGDDVFVFATGYDKDKIVDFDAKNAGHDRIDLSGLKSIDNFNDLKLHHMTGKGGDVMIDGGHGDVLTLHHVVVGDLAKGDFIF